MCPRTPTKAILQPQVSELQGRTGVQESNRDLLFMVRLHMYHLTAGTALDDMVVGFVVCLNYVREFD